MTLELTKEEFLRLSHHNAVSSNRSQRQPQLPFEKEMGILHAVKEQRSNEYIKKKFRTSDCTITKIKKRNGLWGA